MQIQVTLSQLEIIIDALEKQLNTGSKSGYERSHQTSLQRLIDKLVSGEMTEAQRVKMEGRY